MNLTIIKLVVWSSKCSNYDHTWGLSDDGLLGQNICVSTAISSLWQSLSLERIDLEYLVWISDIGLAFSFLVDQIMKLETQCLCELNSFANINDDLCSAVVQSRMVKRTLCFIWEERSFHHPWQHYINYCAHPSFRCEIEALSKCMMSGWSELYEKTWTLRSRPTGFYVLLKNIECWKC